MATIQEYINNKHKYKVDHNYQRPIDAWTLEDNQCLIDTILRNEPMPLFFFNYISSEGIFYVVDGQQRLNAIKLFYDNKIKLSKKFSNKANDGKTFNGDNPISDQQRKDFLDYNLQTHILEDYGDEKVRLIFSRLQRGKPLQLGERLNAKPGTVVERMREIAKHPFMWKSTGVYKERYGIYPDAARILFYEKYGAAQCGSNELNNFFDNNKDMQKDDKDYKSAFSTLNYLAKCFPADPGDYQYLEKHAWILAVYSMVRELSIGYALADQEKKIQKFIVEFHSKVYSEDMRRSNSSYQRFYDNVRGGWSEKIIKLRRDILVNEFLKKNKLFELDDKRQISDKEKIAVFGKKTSCEMCSKEFKDYREAEYHHKDYYSKGGKTNIKNIMILCEKCHKRIHGNTPIVLPQEKEIAETDE